MIPPHSEHSTHIVGFFYYKVRSLDSVYVYIIWKLVGLSTNRFPWMCVGHIQDFMLSYAVHFQFFLLMISRQFFVNSSFYFEYVGFDSTVSQHDSQAILVIVHLTMNLLVYFKQKF